MKPGLSHPQIQMVISSCGRADEAAAASEHLISSLVHERE